MPSLLLFVHVIAGSIALAAGTVSILARKGSPVHRTSGDLFVRSMWVMVILGAWGAIDNSDSLTTLIALLTFYLLATGWMAAKRSDNEIGTFEIVFLPVGLGIGTAFIIFGERATEFTGAYFALGGLALLGAALDLRMVLRGGFSGAQRIARHLSRIGFAFLIAVNSLFLGQAELFPKVIQDSNLLPIPTLSVIILIIFWFVRTLSIDKHKTATA